MSDHPSHPRRRRTPAWWVRPDAARTRSPQHRRPARGCRVRVARTLGLPLAVLLCAVAIVAVLAPAVLP